jgi:NAD(P)H-hydrate repair Nnr-like enzyme with NAD(P)H-hydrate dehydratase domain
MPASGGTGDVLAGICGSLLAQGWPALDAALGAVWIHGAGADRLVSQGIGPIGMCAGELPAAVRAVLNELVYGGTGVRKS